MWTSILIRLKQVFLKNYLVFGAVFNQTFLNLKNVNKMIHYNINSFPVPGDERHPYSTMLSLLWIFAAPSE